MSFVIGLAVIGTLGWLAIMAATVPQVPERHPHMAALDRLGRRDVEPCWACRGTGETDYPGGRSDACWECRGTGSLAPEVWEP